MQMTGSSRDFFDLEALTLKNGIFDPNADETITSLSVMGEYAFLFVGIITLVVMAWTLYENWELGSW